MARNGTGTYALPYSDVVTNTPITITWANGTLHDVRDALTASIANDGQTPILANLPMATYRHTGVGNALARTDYAATGQVQDSSFLYGGTAGGTADALTITLVPAITAYAAGQKFRCISGASPSATTTPTITVNGVSAITFKRADGTACVAGDIPASTMIEFTYNGTNMLLQPVNLTTAPGVVPVTGGGTGRATSTTAYGLLAAGTTATGAHQTLSAGATTDILVGGGASALPSWTTATGTGAPVRAGSPTFTGTAVFASLAPSGNIALSGTGNRFTADMTNATIPSRFAFQTSTLNGATSLTVIPNGSSTSALLNLETDPALTNSSLFQIITDGTTSSINSSHRGSGADLPLTVKINSSEALRVDTSRNLLVGVTSANANGGVLQLKSGVTFPATQVAATDVNTLDDYEEGTWTPAVKFGGASVGLTYTTQNGFYTKIGDLVFISVRIGMSAKGSSTGTATISGLPFAVLASASVGGGMGFATITYTGTPTVQIAGGASTIDLSYVSEAGTQTVMNDTNFANTSSIIFSISYKTTT